MKTSIKNIVNFYKKYPQYKNKIYVKTPYGFKKIEEAEQTDYSIPVKIKTQNFELVCSVDHEIKINDSDFIKAKELKIGDKILTKDGLEKIEYKRKFIKPRKLYDLQVADVKQYYTNSIVSHNSTIFVDAVLFALFGKTLKNTANQYIPNRSFSEHKVETFVRLNFIVNSKQYTSLAVIKKTGYPVNFRLFENGIEITKSSTPQTKDFLKNEVLKCTFGLFVNSIILSASNSYNFFEMNKSQRREYIEHIFKITCFGEMLKLIRFDANQLAKHILIEQQEQRNYVSNLKTYQQNFETFKKDKEDTIEEINRKIYIKNSSKDIIRIYDVSWSEHEKKLDDYKKRYSEISKALQVFSEDYNTNVSMINHTTQTIEKNKEILSLVCNDCKNKIDKEYLIELELNIQNFTEKNLVISSDKNVLNTLLIKLKDNIKFEKAEISRRKKEHNICEQNKLKIKFIDDDICALKKDVKREKEKKNPFKVMIDTATVALSDLTKILDAHYSEKTELEILEHVVSDDGAKKFMIKDLITILNSLIRQYLEEMGAEFTVHFNEAFDSTFLTNTGECEYNSFSAGERQRINVATLFAFRDILSNTGIESNVFVLDEVIDQGIDEYALKAILGILKRTVEEKEQTIFIISHRPETSENMDFDNIIEIEKQYSISKIKQDAQGEK